MSDTNYKEALELLFPIAKEIISKAYFQAPQYDPDNLPEFCQIERKDIEDLDIVLSKIQHELKLI
jgi:hypothetical protein